MKSKILGIFIRIDGGYSLNGNSIKKILKLEPVGTVHSSGTFIQ
jgi:hypothetical protein